MKGYYRKYRVTWNDISEEFPDGEVPSSLFYNADSANYHFLSSN